MGGHRPLKATPDVRILTTEEVRIAKISHAYAIGRIKTIEELEATIAHVLAGGSINGDGTLPGDLEHTHYDESESPFTMPQMETVLKL